MSVKITEWDPSEYLDNEESIEAYLNAAFEDGDPQLIASAIGDVARARGMTQIARETGLAREALYRALSGKGNPELGTIIGVLKTFNMQFRVKSVPSQINYYVNSGLPNVLYSKIIPSEIINSSITANTAASVVKSGNTGVSNEHQGSIIRIAGPISGARIRTKVRSPSSAPTRPTFKHAVSTA